ncbi:hypothetical protein FN846DRAFT_963666 [Sphaerosporella brunnea]|uniref:Uncharacterized protein n=1 Tax=Sphaerosporella brunnea TaxID=1250544 RepID=A0A5J5ENR8_9PEZI|nr:hypothetical protein FN846DRAFT_963666 [Sphaerosporella brunnea]
MSHGHPENSSFFRAHPNDWSIHAYLNFRRPSSAQHRRVLEGWKKSLQTIANCTAKYCCTRQHRDRARELIARYDEKGKGSDKQYGRTWLREQIKKQKASTPAAETARAINIGAVYNGPVTRSFVSQNCSNAASSSSNTGVPDDNEAPDEEGEGDDDDDASTLHGSEDRDPTPDNDSEELSAAQTTFADTFSSMREDHKWVLASGRAVETVIFEACQAMDHDTFTKSIARSFVLDISDTAVEGWFSEVEWKEIRSALIPLPETDMVLVESMRRFFPVKTTEDLQNVLSTTNYLPKDTHYASDVHFNSSWADLVIRIQLMLFRAPGEPLRASHLEDWYNSNIWSQIIDNCLLDLPGMTLERGETVCRATALRKNRNRTKTGGLGNRQKIGPRIDGIIRTVEDDFFEYGGIEVARSFSGGMRSTKWLSDSLKLAKALRDMLFRLHELADHDKAIVKKLQVVGIFNAGLSFQLIRMSNPKGYVSVLQREKRQEVPKSVSDLQKLFPLLKCVAQMKVQPSFYSLYKRRTFCR